MCVRVLTSFQLSATYSKRDVRDTTCTVLTCIITLSYSCDLVSYFTEIIEALLYFTVLLNMVGKMVSESACVS